MDVFPSAGRKSKSKMESTEVGYAYMSYRSRTAGGILVNLTTSP